MQFGYFYQKNCNLVTSNRYSWWKVYLQAISSIQIIRLNCNFGYISSLWDQKTDEKASGKAKKVMDLRHKSKVWWFFFFLKKELNEILTSDGSSSPCDVSLLKPLKKAWKRNFTVNHKVPVNLSCANRIVDKKKKLQIGKKKNEHLVRLRKWSSYAIII